MRFAVATEARNGPTLNSCGWRSGQYLVSHFRSALINCVMRAVINGSAIGFMLNIGEALEKARVWVANVEDC